MQFCEATGLIGQITDFALGVIEHVGYLGAILVVGIENILPFIPSEVILPALGMATWGGSLPVDGVLGVLITVLVVTFASVLGAGILFGVSRAIGEERIEKIPFVKKDAVKKADAWFIKHGAFAVFICRIIPVVRVLITIPAGLSHMKLRSFLLFTTLGSLVWNAALVSAGAAVGSAWCEVEPVFSHYSHLTVAALLILLVIAVLVKKYIMHQSAPIIPRSSKESSGDDAAAHPSSKESSSDDAAAHPSSKESSSDDAIGAHVNKES